MESKKVVWSEGMFLSPQHFQQQERYFEGFVRNFAGQYAPKAFGLTELVIDHAMLNIGKVAVRKARGVFPDGTPFSITEELVIDIPAHTHYAKVYLALPVRRAGAVNVGEDMRYRYRSTPHDIYDTTRENSDAAQVELSTLNIQLKLEGEDLSDYALLTIVEVQELKPDGEIKLNHAFVPQCLQFGVSQYLTDTLSDIFAQIQYRARTISTRLQADCKSKSYQSMMRDYLWLQMLGAWMPKLEQWHVDGSLLTKYLYHECISMAGQMQGLEGKMPTSFATWNQDDLYHIFSVVFAEIQVLLREVQIENVTALDWDLQLFNSRRLLRTLVKDRSLFAKGRFILVVTSSIGPARLGNEFPKASKLAGNSDIANLVRNALSGVSLRHLPYAPSELKSRHDAAYFEIDTNDDLWQALISKDEAIALHIDDCIDNVNVGFHVIR
ncbi:type VI secretion system baseplate subunit TssK [Veronia pacifica]|uniref:type VI secretion system baseplate subunit TssK n=1 Tax=Veronia pacifica TaxID=1080227 RepID=UPI0009F1F402